MIVIMLGCFVMSACVDDDYTELNKGETELALTASSADITLAETTRSDEV